jgi:hypothetical protein
MFFQCFSHHWYVSKEYASTPFPFFLEHLTFFLLSISQIHSNGIVLTQSFCLLRRFDSRSKCMRICYYCNIDTILCCYIRRDLLYQQYHHSRLDLNMLFQCPAGDSVLSVALLGHG